MTSLKVITLDTEVSHSGGGGWSWTSPVWLPHTLFTARLIFWPQAASVFALPIETLRPTDSGRLTESMRRSVSEAALAQPEGLLGTDSLKKLTIKDLSFKGNSEPSDSPEMSQSMETLGPSTPSDVNFFLRSGNSQEESETKDDIGPMDGIPRVRAAFPDGFHPRRSSQGVLHMPLYSSPIVKNPFMSPLLAPDGMLKTLPPVHLVVRTRRDRVSMEGSGMGHERPGEKLAKHHVASQAGESCHLQICWAGGLSR